LTLYFHPHDDVDGLFLGEKYLYTKKYRDEYEYKQVCATENTQKLRKLKRFLSCQLPTASEHECAAV
jgi:hypothetical protein